jgi:glycosyltransferase involved in cell wall biosynthesis
VVAVSWRDLANPSAGGAEILIDRLLTGLAERGHNVSLVCGGPVAENEYETVNAGGTYSQYLRAPAICAARFGQSDVMIDVENGFPYFSPLWRRKPSLCLVHHVHSDQWHGRFPAPVATICRAIERRVMPAVYRNRLFVAVSNSTAKELRAIGVPASHIRIIESGVDRPSGTSPGKSKSPLFISLNRLVPHKRMELLLNAWDMASKKIPGRLVVAGDGPDLPALRAQAATIPRVEVVGRISEECKQRLLSEAWAIVSTSHHEGWGMSVMEAAAAGTPALAIDAPGIRDAIVDGVTGILVRTRDDEIASSLAEEWVALASDRFRRDSLGAAARERAMQFSWEKTIDRWQEVLEEVASANSRFQRSPR